MYMWHKTSAILSSIYQKLLKLIEIWRSSDRKSLCSLFWDTVYNHTLPSAFASTVIVSKHVQINEG